MKKVKYTNPGREIEKAMETGVIVPDFLPSPENLVLKTPPVDFELSLEEIAKFAAASDIRQAETWQASQMFYPVRNPLVHTQTRPL